MHFSFDDGYSALVAWPSDVSLFIYLFLYISISGLAFSSHAFSSCFIISKRCNLKEVYVEEPAL